MKDRIIEMSLDSLDPSGERSRLVIELGKPYRAAEREWACPVAIRGLYDRLHDIRGVDSLQALCLAASLIRSLLEDYIQNGGTLMHPGSDYPYDIRASFSRVGDPS